MGRFTGYKKVFAMIEEGCNEFALFKHQAYEDQIVRFELCQSKQGQPLMYAKGAMNYSKKDKDEGKNLQRVTIEVAETSLDFELVLYFKKGQSSKYTVEKLKFKTDTKQEKERWVFAINKFTDNLATDITIIDNNEIITIRSTDIFESTNPKNYNPSSLKKLYDQNNKMPSLIDVKKEILSDNSETNTRIQELSQLYD